MAFGELQIVLGLGRLIAGSDFAVSPIGLFQSLADALHLVFGEQALDVQQHGNGPEGKRMAMVLILIVSVKLSRRMKHQKP
ncbi:hypothetical protein D3C73_1297210 [compost metagenome]